MKRSAGEDVLAVPLWRGAALSGVTLACTLGCGSGDEALPASGRCDEPGPVSSPTTRCVLDADTLTASPVDPGSSALRVGLFLATSGDAPNRPWGAAEATEVGRAGIEEADAVLASCQIHLDVQAAQVAAVPAELLAVEGNTPGSWGGAAPVEELDPDLFNYQQNERLVEEPRQLFSHGRALLASGAIAVWVVDDIVYYHAQEATVAGGLSFPPIVYHHPDDFPLRNAILVASGYSGPGSLPSRLNGRTLAHELGHMLLDSGQHLGEPENLMVSGSTLTDEQCAQMRLGLETLYGAAPPIDPLQGGR